MTRQFQLLLFIALCALAAAISTAPTQSADPRLEKFTDAAQAATDERRNRILAEIATLKNHPWAGEYYYGDGLGVNTSFAAAPTNGFAFGWHGCLGLYDRNHGDIVEADGILRPQFTYPNSQKGFQGLATGLLVVPWGNRTYLIDTNEIIDFCNDINRGSEPRKNAHGMHLLRKGDEKKHATGLPAIPAQHKPYLLARAITARVTEVSVPSTPEKNSKYRDVEVKLDAGKKDGLLVGMELGIVSPRDIYDWIEITRVEENHATGKISQSDIDPIPKPGWKLSTKR